MELQTELFEMNPLDELDCFHLLRFFGRNKTEMSCMDNPQIFLTQLRDHQLILEEKYQETKNSSEEMQQNVYELLGWIEKERPLDIKMFWTCVFKEFMMTQYPTLKQLRDSLFDGSLPNGENAELASCKPVTCGDQQGVLYLTQLAKGKPCILSSNKWYTPSEFEKLGGMQSSRNWKQSIRCKDTALKELFKQGHLTCPGYKKSKA